MPTLPRTLQTIQWLLLTSWGLLLIVAFWHGKLNAERTRRSNLWLQRSSALLLVVMAIIFWIGGRNTFLAGFVGFIALGMSISLIADLIMAEIIRVPNRVLGGILVFGSAHLIYLAGIVSAGRAFGHNTDVLLGPTALGFTVFGIVIWLLFVRAPQESTLLNYGALGYAILICVLAGTALTLARLEDQFWMLAAGVLLFVLSDIILGNQIFRRNNWYLVREVVWFTYISGQALIVWTSATVL